MCAYHNSLMNGCQLRRDPMVVRSKDVYKSVSVAEILGGQGGRSPPHFLRRGGNAPPLFLRTEQFNLKLELFLAIHQRMEVALTLEPLLWSLYNSVPPINFPIIILIMINSQHSSQHSSHALAMLPFFAPPLFTCSLCPCVFACDGKKHNISFDELIMCSTILPSACVAGADPELSQGGFFSSIFS